MAKVAACAAVLGCLLMTCWLTDGAQAQSFSCRGDLASDERAICDDSELAQLDVELQNTYDRAMRKAPPNGQRQIRDQQRNWLNQRRGCGSNRGCLRDIYRDQIAWLQQFD
jgi:uncharacterized protein